jgi:phage-related protein/DNA-binding XRE family transcriptional regulator
VASFQAVYYRASDGSEPVRELLQSFECKRRVSLLHQIARLNLLSDQVRHLPLPHSSPVDGELRELRHAEADHYRVLYRRSEELFVLLHAYRKTAGVPTSEFDIARTRWLDFQSRNDPSPIGSSVAEDIDASLEDAEFRSEHERLAPCEALAQLVIMRRGGLGFSQHRLARHMHTTPSAISRIESGQHGTNARTLIRIAEALEARAVIGFDYGPTAIPQRELVALSNAPWR